VEQFLIEQGVKHASSDQGKMYNAASAMIERVRAKDPRRAAQMEKELEKEMSSRRGQLSTSFVQRMLSEGGIDVSAQNVRSAIELHADDIGDDIKGKGTALKRNTFIAEQIKADVAKQTGLSGENLRIAQYKRLTEHMGKKAARAFVDMDGNLLGKEQEAVQEGSGLGAAAQALASINQKKDWSKADKEFEFKNKIANMNLTDEQRSLLMSKVGDNNFMSAGRISEVILKESDTGIPHDRSFMGDIWEGIKSVFTETKQEKKKRLKGEKKSTLDNRMRSVQKAAYSAFEKEHGSAALKRLKEYRAAKERGLAPEAGDFSSAIVEESESLDRMRQTMSKGIGKSSKSSKSSKATETSTKVAEKYGEATVSEIAKTNKLLAQVVTNTSGPMSTGKGATLSSERFKG
jgi:hypothetical protein